MSQRLSKQEQRAWELEKKDFTRQQIANELGVHLTRVSQIRGQLKKKGYHKDEWTRGYHRLRTGSGKEVIVGSFYHNTLQKLSPKQREWLAQQVPEGGTAADFAVALMVDAYYEDTGDTDV